MRGLGGKSGFFLGVWLVAISATVALLWHEDRFFASAGMPVASVSQTTRDVSYRSEDDVRWKALDSSGQKVFDGDRLATGLSSAAVIDFGDGRAASLGPDTSLSIRTIRQSSGMTYIIGLARGSVAVEKIKVTNSQIKNRFPIIIRSGGRDYQIEPGEERGIVRDDKGVSEFVGKRRPSVAKFKADSKETAPAPTPRIDVPVAVVANLIQETPAAVIDTAVGESVVVTPESTPTAAVAPMPPPPAAKVKPVKVSAVKKAPQTEVVEVPKATGAEIQLDYSSLGHEYYTFQSLATLEGDLGTLKWREPVIRQQGLEWLPAVEIKNGPNRKEMALVAGGARALKIEDLGPLHASAERDGLPCALIELRGGAKVSAAGKKPVWSFTGDAMEVSVCSYKDAVEKLPLVVGIGSLESKGTARGRIFRKPGSSGVSLQMVITTPSQFALLQPILQKNENFRIATSQGLAASGIFIGKSGKVIMQLAGSGLTARKADQVRDLVGGDVVFKGGRAAMYDASRITEEGLKNFVSKNLEQGRAVYVQKGSNLFPVSRKFLEERHEVASFVKSVASHLFTEKVEIISYK